MARLSAAALIVGLILAGCAEGAANSKVALVDGSEQVVVPTSAFTCGDIYSNAEGADAADIPDAPPRFVRLKNNKIMMLAAHHNNIPWFTSDGVEFARQSCHSVLKSGLNPNPAAFNNHNWILGFYTKDGRDIFSLVHNEYHGAAYIPACKKRLRKGQAPWDAICLQISMTGFRSKDGGRNFYPSPVDAPVLATTNDKIDLNNASVITRIGIHDPSNIVRNPVDKHFYFVSLVDPSQTQKRGLCLFRSKDPLTEPWYAWDGAAFKSKMGSPYAGEGSPCTPVRPWGTYIPAVTWNTKLKKFLAIGRSDSRQLVALTSPDLIHWDREIPLRPSVQQNWWKPLSGDPDPDSYYSLFDATSKSRFFDTTGSSPYLYFIRWKTNLLKVKSREREIVRVKLRIDG